MHYEKFEKKKEKKKKFVDLQTIDKILNICN